jgi:hypothetical protein
MSIAAAIRRLLPACALVLGACASHPAARPVTDVKVLAGKWEGWITPPAGGRAVEGTLIVKEDGSYVVSTINGVDGGNIYLENGRLMFKSRPATGMMVLHEEDGKRVLRAVATDGAVADWTPAK